MRATMATTPSWETVRNWKNALVLVDAAREPRFMDDAYDSPRHSAAVRCYFSVTAA